MAATKKKWNEFDTAVTGNMVLKSNGFVMDINDTIGNIDALLEKSGYPKIGDIPVLNRKIFKGQRVTIREHPYVVSIRRHHSHYLVGTLLTRNVVLTVAHPLADVPTTELGIVMGENYADRGTSVATVVIVLLHQDFDPYTLNADIAMLRIYEDVNFRYAAKGITLASPTLEVEGNMAFVTGWGRCDNTGSELCLNRASKYYPDERFDPMLRSISFKMSLSNYYCSGYKRHEVSILKGMLCAGPAREEDPVCPCLGVPGAPLVVQSRLLGLLSWGFGCGYGHDLPLIYSSVRTHDSWILQNIVQMGKVKQSNLTQLFIATKAYLIAEWFIKTRVKTPSVKIKQDKSMEPLEVDEVLAQLQGTVYDVRDCISGGYYSLEKKNLYENLNNERIRNKLNLMLNKEVHDQVQPRPFISNTVDVEQKWFPNRNNSISEER